MGTKFDYQVSGFCVSGAEGGIHWIRGWKRRRERIGLWLRWIMHTGPSLSGCLGHTGGHCSLQGLNGWHPSGFTKGRGEAMGHVLALILIYKTDSQLRKLCPGGLWFREEAQS